MRRLHEAFTILFRYIPDGELCAMHDKLLFRGPTPDKLTEEDAKRLEGLLVYWDETEESWYVFT